MAADFKEPQHDDLRQSRQNQEFQRFTVQEETSLPEEEDEEVKRHRFDPDLPTITANVSSNEVVPNDDPAKHLPSLQQASNFPEALASMNELARVASSAASEEARPLQQYHNEVIPE